MYEQFLYYWLLWIIFIIPTFFMDKTKKRFFVIGWILSVIISSTYEIGFHQIQISVAFCVMLIGSLIFYALESVSFYKLFITFTVMISYVSILLWAKITPVWFFMPPLFIIAIITVLLIRLFYQSLYEQIAVALVALALGQLVFQFILISYHLDQVIGGEQFFIQISLVVLFQILLFSVQVVIQGFSRFFERKFTSLH